MQSITKHEMGSHEGCEVDPLKWTTRFCASAFFFRSLKNQVNELQQELSQCRIQIADLRHALQRSVRVGAFIMMVVITVECFWCPIL